MGGTIRRVTAKKKVSHVPEGFKERWANLDASGDAERYIGILNQVRDNDDPTRYPTVMAFVDPQPGERILEIGCGNGAIARAVAKHMHSVAEVVATDFSCQAITEATRHTIDSTLPLHFIVADAHNLPFDDASFDRSYAMEIFVILPDPRKALDELLRVTRPGGQIRIWESDCDASAIDGTDLELTRRIQRFIGDHEYNGAVARQIIGWCREMGHDVSYTAALGVQETGKGLRSLLLPEWLGDAVRAGALTQDEVERWLEDQEEREATGRYLSYIPHFRIAVTKAGS